MKKLLIAPLLLLGIICESQDYESPAYYHFTAKYKGDFSSSGNEPVVSNKVQCNIRTYVKEIYAFVTEGEILIGQEKYKLVEEIYDKNRMQIYKATDEFNYSLIISRLQYLSYSGGIEKYVIFIYGSDGVNGKFYECYPRY